MINDYVVRDNIVHKIFGFTYNRSNRGLLMEIIVRIDNDASDH